MDYINIKFSWYDGTKTFGSSHSDLYVVKSIFCVALVFIHYWLQTKRKKNMNSGVW